MTCASTIVDLLEAKHGKDVFVRECKDGPTWFGNHSRLDAWAMRRSWTRPCYWAYEVKVSRSDFLQDRKWDMYLPLCNELSFVCPTGLIKPEECPEPVGLLYVAKTGTRLFTKKKAVYREVEPPVELMHYLLMRATSFDVGRGLPYERETNAEYWRRWLETKAENRELGRRVSHAVHAIVAEKVTRVNNENVRLESQLKQLQDVRDLLEQHGLSPSTFQLERKVEDLLLGHPPRALKAAADGLGRSLDRFNDAWDAHVAPLEADS